MRLLSAIAVGLLALSLLPASAEPNQARCNPGGSLDDPHVTCHVAVKQLVVCEATTDTRVGGVGCGGEEIAGLTEPDTCFGWDLTPEGSGSLCPDPDGDDAEKVSEPPVYFCGGIACEEGYFACVETVCVPEL